MIPGSNEHRRGPASFLLLLFLLVATATHSSEGQRLGQGASDWYMRFHDFDLVKRHADRPVTQSFYVHSVVLHRYAVTHVSTVVHNPAKVKQVFSFGFAMPKAAFISNVTLQRNNETVHSQVNESDWDLFLHGDDWRAEANGNGHANGAHHRQVLPRDKLDALSSDQADFKQFVLPLHLQPNDTVQLTLRYEYLLKRRMERYVHAMSISPGEIVKDFTIFLSIGDHRPLKNVNLSAPVMGEVTDQALQEADNHTSIRFRMSEVEQFEYFGRHGFTGDFKATFDVDDVSGGEMDMIVEDGHFLHFYDVPRPMQSIPKHVIFLLDNSVSMSGPKMEHAKDAMRLLMSSLNKRDLISFLVFNESVTFWQPDVLEEENNVNQTQEELEQAFAVNGNLTDTISDYLDQLCVTSGHSNMTLAILTALKFDEQLWLTGAMPDNAYSMLIVLTDGRSHRNRTDAKAVRRSIRLANKLSRLPIFILGMGFDANMDFLENIAEKSGAVAASIIEDLEVEPQLRSIQPHLNEVVLKNLRINYIGSIFDHSSITNTLFKSFHQGSSAAAAGRLQTLSPEDEKAGFYSELEVEITGQSAENLYMDNPPVFSLSPAADLCSGHVTLCSELKLEGSCVTLNMSRADLKEFNFGNRASSLKIDGSCSWTVFTEAYYQGLNVTLMPGTYEAIPDLHKSISSLKMARYDDESGSNKTLIGVDSKLLAIPEKEEELPSQKNFHSVQRIWAYLTIQEVLHQLEFRPEAVSQKDIERATRIAMHFSLLTPFTDMYLKEETLNSTFVDSVEHEEDQVEPFEDMIENSFLSYQDLNPVFLSLDDPDMASQWEALKSCRPPVQCVGDFHYEEIPDPLPEELGDEAQYDLDDLDPWDNCTGTLNLFTKPNFEGDHLAAKTSIRQLYHSVNSQRMGSIRVHGDCCWLLFDHRFFSGHVDKVCGAGYEQQLRMTNIGSIKRIGGRPTT